MNWYNKRGLVTDTRVLTDELFEAAISGSADIVCIVHDKGVDLDAINVNGETPLIRAAERGNTDVVNALLNNGVNINTRDRYGMTALMYAAQNNHADIVRTLIAKGADQSIQRHYDNMTALRLAVSSQYYDIVQIFEHKT